MNKDLETLIATHIELIDNEHYEEFFLLAINQGRLETSEFMDLVDILNQAGIDTSEVREELMIRTLDMYIEDIDTWMYMDDIFETFSPVGSYAVNSFERRSYLVKEWADKRSDVDYSGYETSEFELMYKED